MKLYNMNRKGFASGIAVGLILTFFLLASSAAAVDTAKFIGDTTYPDRSVVDANKEFIKTWKFENTGTTDWVGYTFNYLSGDKFGDTLSVPIKETKRGEFVEISVTFKAPPPPTPAVKEGTWIIKNKENIPVTGGKATIIVTINPTPDPNKKIPDLSKASYNSLKYNHNDVSYTDGINPFAKSGYGGQCTAFAWGRANEKLNIKLSTTSRARRWWDETEFPKGDIPRANSIAVWEEYSKNLFVWDDIPGTGEEKLKSSLIANFKYNTWNLEWIKEANIEKTGSTITVSNKTNSIKLILNNDKTKGNMEINDGRDIEKSHILIVKMKDNKLNIYKEQYGHVAYVEEVNGEEVIINQANTINPNYYWGAGYEGEPKSTTKLGMDTVIGKSFGLLGYIYLQPIDVLPEDPQELIQYASDTIRESIPKSTPGFWSDLLNEITKAIDGVKEFFSIPEAHSAPPTPVLTSTPTQTTKPTLTPVITPTSTPLINSYELSSNGLQFIATHEGFRPQLYDDAGGHCTIGYGHLVHTGVCNGGESADFKAGITQTQGLEILNSDVQKAVKAVNSKVIVQLNQNQFDAMVSFTFNVGAGGFSGSTVLNVLNAGKYESVPTELNRYVKSGGVQLQGLVNRRNDEGVLFMTPVIPIPTDEQYAGIRAVFGQQWAPAPIFVTRGLVTKGVYGAVNINGGIDVYTIGPGGTKETPESYYQKFGTYSQDGIVGTVTIEQAQQLGINVPTPTPIPTLTPLSTPTSTPTPVTPTLTPTPTPTSTAPPDPYAGVRAVFGSQWTPAPIFVDRGLVNQGVYGAVNINGGIDVYTIGPGGTKETPESYYQKFGTYSQDGIVGTVTIEQAQQLGINV